MLGCLKYLHDLLIVAERIEQPLHVLEHLHFGQEHVCVLCEATDMRAGKSK